MFISRRRAVFAAILSSVVSAGYFTAPAHAEHAEFVLSCENGRNYPFHTQAISPDGDVVTGILSLAPRSGVKLRLIPMGVGYRYAGHGIWFDGLRESALLFLHKDAAISCTVSGPDAMPVLYTKG
jgi:hypothetical protein